MLTKLLVQKFQVPQDKWTEFRWSPSPYVHDDVQKTNTQVGVLRTLIEAIALFDSCHTTNPF